VEVVLYGDMVVKGKMKIEADVFSCGSTCGKKLICGNHVCCDIWHPGSCGECDCNALLFTKKCK
jgi:transcriptional repressor NF-X1